MICFHHRFVGNDFRARKFITLLLFFLGVKVENLTVIPPTVFAEQSNAKTFLLSWEKGSDVIITIDYGDGQSLRWAWDEQNHTLSYRKKNVTLNHSYTVLANYTLKVSATNQAGTVNVTATIVVEPNLQTFINYTSKYIPGPTPLDMQFQFSLLPTVTSPIPVIFWCNFTYDDPSNTKTQNLTYCEVNGVSCVSPYTYVTDRPFSVPHILCYNHISSVPFNDNITLRQNITELKISSEQLGWKTLEDAASFKITMSRGSHITLDVDFGDGQTNTTGYPYRVAGNTSTSFSHVYNTPNNYTVRVKAYNEYYQNDTTYVLIIQNKVQGITIRHIPPIAYPPGTFSLSLVPDTSLPIPTNMWFNATLTGISILQESYANSITSGSTHSETVNVGRSNVGENQDIIVTGYNLASKMNFTTSVSVYEVITGISLTPEPKTTLPNETWSLHIAVATGSSINFTVDFGDGDVQMVQHDKLFGTDLVTIVNKTYTYVGNFTVRVTASNPVSSKTASFIHEWSCYPPNITLPSEVLDEANPRKVFKSLPYKIEPQLHLVCIDTQTVLFQWTVLDYATKNAHTYSTQDKIFNLTARALHYGKYIVRLNASMLNEVNTTSIEDSYVEIVKTPLVASIKGGKESGTVFGRTANINGIIYSLDLDEFPVDQKRGLLFRYVKLIKL